VAGMLFDANHLPSQIRRELLARNGLLSYQDVQVDDF